MKDYTDIQLVNLLTEGNSPAFEEIYRRYWLKLFRIAYHHLGVKEECEEIIQNVFLSIWKRRTEIRIQRLDIYLTVSVKNQIYDFIKSQINYRKYQEYLIFQEVAQTHNPLHFSELSEAVENALSKLPEKTAEVFRRSRFQNQSVKEIADELHLTPKTVEYHITKSLKHLKENLWMYNSKN